MEYHPSNYQGITNSKTVTKKGQYVLDAYQNNPAKPNTLAYNLARKLEMVDGVAFHNSYPRGIDLLTIMDKDEIFGHIADGSFKDEYIGDYFDITIHTEYTPTETVRCIIGMFDPFLNTGDTPLTRHHALIVPKNCFTKTHQMNPTDTTECGYRNSSIWTVLDKYADAIIEAIGSEHLIMYRKLTSNKISETGISMGGAGLTGCSNGWNWYNAWLCLLSEIQVYSSNVWSSSGYDTGIDNFQLPLFALNPTAKICKAGGVDDASADNRISWWLKNVSSTANFCYCDQQGNSNAGNASISRGIHPFWLIG